MERTIVSNWKGSVHTAEHVRKQITARWGVDEANNYDPKSNCLTFSKWLKAGYKVKKGETALKSFLIIEERDDNGEIVLKHVKIINLFYIRQVEYIG